MWIHLLTLGLIDGASGATPPEPPVVQNSGGWVEYRKPPKKKIEPASEPELLATGAPAEVVVAKAQPQRIAVPPPAVDKQAVAAVSAAVQLVRQAAEQYNATIQRQRREEEELMLMF